MGGECRKLLLCDIFISESQAGAIREGREPNSSFRRVIDCYRVLGQLEEQLGR